MKSPCIGCEFEKKDKNNDTCMNCEKRLAYIEGEDLTERDKVYLILNAEKTKFCGRCKRKLPTSAFYGKTGSKDGLQYWCKPCHNEMTKLCRKPKNPPQQKEKPATPEKRKLPEPSPQILDRTGQLIVSECAAIQKHLLEKNASYGNSAIEPVRIFSKADPIEQINVRLDDKLSRLIKGHDYPGDNDELDIIGYLVLKRVARRVHGAIRK